MSGLPPAFTGFAFPGLENLRNDIYPAIDAASTPSLHQPGKVVLITGAGRGIGRGIALQYAHAKVASIVLVARSSKELDEVEASIQKISSSTKVYKKSISVTDDAAVAQLAQEVTSNEGRLDILVNNAGASADWVPIDQGKPAQWWGAMEVNLKGPYLFIQAFLPLLTATNEKHGAGVHVINITSIGAHSLDPDASSYMISKLAVLRLSEFLHVGHAGKGIVSVGVHPGGVVTAMSDQEERLKPYLNDSTDLCGGFLVWLTSQKREWTGGRYLAATWDVEKLDSMKEEIIDGDKLKVRMVV